MMRRLLICIFMIAGLARAYGQEDVLEKGKVVAEGGIKADAVFLNFLAKSAPGATSTLTPGGSLGGFADIWFNDWIGIRPELNLNYKQTVMGWEANSGRMKSFGIEVPIYVVGHFDVFKSHHVFVGIGPYTEFTCYARWMIGDRNVDLLKINADGEPMIQDNQSGFGAILGYEFGNGLAVDISYKLCCFNILQPNTSQGVSLYPQTVSLGLAYKFRKR